MTRFRKRQLAGAIVAALSVLPGVAAAQAPDVAPETIPAIPPPAPEATAAPAAGGAQPSPEAQLDTLLGELAEPGRDDWEQIEGKINALWSRSGSPAMDLLLKRGSDAIEAEDYPTAVEHLSALVELAPDFAEGWNARATAFFLMDEYSLSMADVEHVLALEPRHFGALSGLAFMFEAMDEPTQALAAFRAVHALNPNRPNINEAITRLERITGEAEL